MKSNIKRVLVADDHSLFRRGIVGLLEAADYEVVAQANDGAAAVENTRKLQPDLVLLDISMPKMNGLEALKIIKAEFPAIYVVMLTLSEENSDLLEAVKHGANGYLMKDLNYHEFIDMLSGLENGEAAITRKTASQLMVSLADNTNQLAEPNSP
ncbi:MAG: response regulator transcription factor, partial [Chloroflexota bacterium]